MLRGPALRAPLSAVLCAALLCACAPDPWANVEAAWPEDGDTDALLDPTRVHELALEIPDASWAELKERPRYLTGAWLEYLGWRVPVGLRIKGNGSFRPIESGLKSPFRIDFEHIHEHGEFFRLSGLTLNNMLHDNPHSSEHMSFRIFRELGVPAPRTAYARLSVNGEDWGLYLMVEPIGKKFLRRHFGNDAGNLYEATYLNRGPESLIYCDFVPERLDICEHDVEGLPEDRADLRSLAEALRELWEEAELLPEPPVGVEPLRGDPDPFDDLPGPPYISNADEALALLDDWLDLDEFARYAALELALVHWDGYIGNSNNSKFYFDPADERFHFMPWGLDGTLKFPWTLGTTGFRPPAGKHPGLLFHTFISVPELRIRHVLTLAEIADELEALDLPAEHARVYDLIAEHVRADPRKLYSNEEFERENAEQRELMHALPERIRALLPR